MPTIIGFWHDRSPFCKWVHPHYLIDHNWPQAERQAVAEYLKAGQEHISYLGYSWCRLDPDRRDFGTRDFTDGTFIWPEALHIYVDEFHVKLPQEAIDHMLGRKKFDESQHKNFWESFCSNFPLDFVEYPSKKAAQKRPWNREDAVKERSRLRGQL